MHGWHSTQTKKKLLTQLQPAFPLLFLPNSSCTCYTMSFLLLALTTCMKNPVRSPLSTCYSCFPQSRSKITWAVSARCAARVPAQPEPCSEHSPFPITSAFAGTLGRSAAQLSAWSRAQSQHRRSCRAHSLCDSWEQQHTLDRNQTQKSGRHPEPGLGCKVTLIGSSNCNYK